MAISRAAEGATVRLGRCPSAREIATGAQVYAPGVIESDLGGSGDGALLACYTPDGAAVCLAALAGDPDAETGLVAELERVLV